MKKRGDSPARLRLAAVGLEAELSLVVDEVPAKPERVFGSPRAFIRGQLRHRQLHPVVDVDGVDVRIGADGEADGQRIAAVIAGG